MTQDKKSAAREFDQIIAAAQFVEWSGKQQDYCTDTYYSGYYNYAMPKGFVFVEAARWQFNQDTVAYEALQIKFDEAKSELCRMQDGNLKFHRENAALQKTFNKTLEFLNKDNQALQSKLAEQAAEIERLHEKYDLQALVKRDEAQKERIAELEKENDRLSKLFAKNVLGICDNMEDLYKGQIQSLTEQNSILREGLKAIVKKAPTLVSREEAADMACEFKIVAREALASADKAKGE